MTQEELYYAWYSEKQAECAGVVEYVDLYGNIVTCTCVTKSPHDHGTKWGDIIFKGPVTEFRGRVSWGKYQPYYMDYTFGRMFANTYVRIS